MSYERVIIHDLSEEELSSFTEPGERDKVISATDRAVSCMGCFGCWLKTPGKCLMGDSLQFAGAAMAQCEEIVIISRCRYGEYSAGVKRAVDRAISSNLPFFTYRGWRLHHVLRYKSHPALTAYLYGDMTDLEKEIAVERVRAQGRNIGASEVKVLFSESAEKLREVRQ